jgi:hypothetical protein
MVIAFVGVPAESPKDVLGTAPQGPFFCGPPTESCDIQLAGSLILKWAFVVDGVRNPMAPTANDSTSAEVRLLPFPPSIEAPHQRSIIAFDA